MLVRWKEAHVGISAEVTYINLMSGEAPSPDERLLDSTLKLVAHMGRAPALFAALRELADCLTSPDRFGPPGAARRLSSAVATFVALILTLLARQRANSSRIVFTAFGRRVVRELSHPPSAWAAP